VNISAAAEAAPAVARGATAELPGVAIAPKGVRASPALASSPSPFALALARFDHELSEGEVLMDRAISTARPNLSVGPAELIALQAGVYRYAQAVDLVSRLVDRATTAVKTVVQAQ
jgi:hypothetical protein